MGRTYGLEAPAARRWAVDIRCFRACILIACARGEGLRLLEALQLFTKRKYLQKIVALPTFGSRDCYYLLATEELFWTLRRIVTMMGSSRSFLGLHRAWAPKKSLSYRCSVATGWH